MFRTTLKSILGHKARLLGTATAIILGVSFLVGTLIFTDSVSKSFDELFTTIFEDLDAEVRSSEVIEVDFGEPIRGTLPESYADIVATVEGMESFEAYVMGSGQLVGNDGNPIGNPSQGPPTFVTSWDGQVGASPWNLTEGTAPVGPDALVIDKGSADAGELSLGDRVTVLGPNHSQEYELVGIVLYGDVESLAGTTFAIMDLPTAQEFLGLQGQLTGISIVAADGVDPEDLVDRLNAVLDESAEAVTGEALRDENINSIQEALGFINIFLTVFALIALFVASFVIYNTFAILVAQRQRELALLRAIGASSRQVLGSVFVEAAVVGLVASGLGIAVGMGLAVGLNALLSALGLALPSSGLVVQSSTIISGVVAGMVVTLVSAIFPALRAARIAPIEAMREAAAETQGYSTTRLLSGLAITGAGVAALLVGLLRPTIQLVGLGAAVLFIGVFVLGPVLARPVARVIGLPLARLQGVPGTLARDNAMRNPKRTARTAAALTIGVALVAGVSVLASSLKVSVREIIADQFTGDFVIESGSFGLGSGLPTTMVGELQALPEVAAAASVRLGLAEIDGRGDFLTVIDPTVAFEVFDVGIVSGGPEDLDDNAIFLHVDRAEQLGVELGDTVPVRFLSGPRDLVVRGLYERIELAGNYVISTALYEASGAEQFDIAAYVLTAPGVSAEAARAAIHTVADRYPNATVQDRQEYIDTQAAQLDFLVNMIYALLGLAVIIAAFGIANTLRLSIIERTREIGLLRAVGMSRRQLRRTIRTEAIITAVLGAVQGLILGLFLGYAVIYALRNEGSIVFDIPVGSLTVVLILAVILGVLASLIPAYRASRLNVLAAIATE